ncbi:G1/S-specific cyclin-E-like isoform X3 [Liolophura sinensis]|uniref:G1/S-specific cyclin-E-like isoform X3 n=1 Tax=Liolophura sinensis TaxID=3198878 RepID=UPI0031597AF5
MLRHSSFGDWYISHITQKNRPVKHRDTERMSRRSARLQSRGRENENEENIRIACRKRKADEDDHRDMEVCKRRQQFQIQNQWIPISESTSVPTCTIIPTKDQTPPSSTGHSTPQEFFIGSQFRFQNYFTTPVKSRLSPLPKFSWADSKEVWQLMMKKDLAYTRDHQMFDRHPCLQPRMRVILLDWLIEVCEVYRLHRETFYLAVDYIDRYLSTQRNIMKHQLQLIGITALLIAAKLEEIYPPKLSEFADVTDGACTENEILTQELVMLKALKWGLSPMTVNSWLNVYLQVANLEQITESEHGFVFPQYSAHAFVQIARLTDLCMLDLGSVQFTNSVLAASALYHMSSESIALAVSGLNMTDIMACVQWMAPHAITIREAGSTELKFFPTIPPEDAHNIQTHAVDVTMLEKAQSRKEDMFVFDSQRSSPDFSTQIPGILTPPQSNKKDMEEQRRALNMNST